jgi:hypothetical protein
VLLVVCCQGICNGSLIGGIRIERWLAHDRTSYCGTPDPAIGKRHDGGSVTRITVSEWAGAPTRSVAWRPRSPNDWRN